jgi:thiol-disulfide isomerase/thioredoxin
MLSISLGPIALPVPPVLLLLAVWVASWLASRLAARQARSADGKDLAAAAGNTIVIAAVLGLLAARLAHLGLDADLYLAAPWSAFDVRDGGWHAPTGAVAAAAWLIWRGLRAPLLRRPLAGATLAGTIVWQVATLATGARDTPPMPGLVLTELNGGALVDLRGAAAGRPVVVNLWASWCGPCRQEMPVLAAAQQREAKVGFLFVNQGESDAAVRTYLASLGLPLREVLLDAASTLGRAVGSRGLPTTLFYDARGTMIDAHFGVLNAAALESRLRTLRPL